MTSPIEQSREPERRGPNQPNALSAEVRQVLEQAGLSEFEVVPWEGGHSERGPYFVRAKFQLPSVDESGEGATFFVDCGFAGARAAYLVGRLEERKGPEHVRMTAIPPNDLVPSETVWAALADWYQAECAAAGQQAADLHESTFPDRDLWSGRTK